MTAHLPALVLLLIGMVLSLGHNSPALAQGGTDSVVSSSGAVVAVDAPPSVALNVYQSDTEIRVFDEQTVTLAADLAVDGTAQGTFNNVSQLTAGTIATGTTVESHLIHFDNINESGVNLSGSVEFDREIIGVIVSDAGLDGTDALLGLASTSYPAAGLEFRGAELNGTSQGDTITVGCDTLTMSLNGFAISDHIRVITGPDTCPDPTATPAPTNTPVPTATPTQGPAPVTDSVVSSSGAVVAVDAPPSVALNVYQSDAEIRVFDEQTVTLAADLAVDGVAQGLFSNISQLTAGTIATGTTVESHLIHFDNINESGVNLSGSVRFDREIIGVIVSDAGLDGTDALLGLASTSYPAAGLEFRGAELNGTSQGDTITVGCDTLTVNLYGFAISDHIRVITGQGTCPDPTATPVPTNTPAPTATPTQGPAPVTDSVVSSSGAVVAVDAPPSVALNVYQSDAEIRVFDEQTVTLLAPLAVDSTGQGTFNNVSQLLGGTIATGTAVESHLIHFDNINESGVNLSGSVRFDREIIGVIVSDTGLDTTDLLLGLPTTTYPAAGLTNRGAELNGTSQGDTIIVGCDTLTMSLNGFAISDHIRVITGQGTCPDPTATPTATATNVPGVTPTATNTPVPTNTPTATPLPDLTRNVLHATLADFGTCGPASNISLTQMDDGEIRLQALLEDYFESGSLDTSLWTTYYPNSGINNQPVFQNGTVSVDAFGLRSLLSVDESDLPVRVEGRVRMSEPGVGTGYADFGLGDIDEVAWTEAGDSNALIINDNSGNVDANTYPPVQDTRQRTRINGFDWTQFHDISMTIYSDRVDYYIDGTLQASHSLNASLQMPLYMWFFTLYSGYDLTGDWVRISNYPASGQFTSCPIDVGSSLPWTTLTFDGETPTGTSTSFETRSSADGATWSDWAALGAGNQVASPAGRYLQYRVSLATTNQNESPTINSVLIGVDGQISATPTPQPTNTPTPAPTNTPTPVPLPTGVSSSFVHDNTDDFGALAACSTTANTYVTNMAGGEIRLAAAVEDYFDGNSLDTNRWTVQYFNGNSTAPTVSNGLLTVNSNAIRSYYLNNMSSSDVLEIEGRIQFLPNGQTNISDFGLSYPDQINVQNNALFITDENNELLANNLRNNDVNQRQRQAISGYDPTDFQDYRIRIYQDRIEYYVNDTLEVTFTDPQLQTDLALYVLATATDAPFVADWVRWNLYPSSGQFTGCVFDAGQSITWPDFNWAGEVPTGTAVTVQTRTSVDGLTWSAWSADNSATSFPVSSPAGRYLQYRLNLSTTDALLSPQVDQISLGNVPTPTPAPTNTATPLPTNTPVPATVTATNTPVPATATPAPVINLAPAGTVSASSLEVDWLPAGNATDGNTGTRWSSAFNDPQWLQVDLGQTSNINRVVLNWETAYGRAYAIQVSNDGSNWTTIYSTTNSDGGVDDLTGLSGSGRYIRMYGTQRGTQWGYSLWEFEVYGSVVTAPTATPTNTPVPPTATPTPLSGSGQILREWWSGISGTSISNLTGNAAYPNNPTGSNLLTSFEAPTNWADNYGTRVRGYLYPPATGQYRFWIAGDDNSELWLSTNATAANAVRIANVPGWSNSREWNKYSEQQSTLITLQAGQRYYIEALQKEGGGGDNLAVAWQIPGGSQQVIAGQYLSPYQSATPTPTATATNTPVPPTATPTSTPVAACQSFTLEGEAAALFGSFTTGSDANASGGRFIHVPEGTGYQSGPNSNRAEFNFSLAAAGTYQFRGYVYGADGTSDSFWVTVDGQPTSGYLWDTQQNTSYVADYISNRDGADPVQVQLAAGSHTLTLSNREDGTRLDRLEVICVAGSTPTSQAVTSFTLVNADTNQDITTISNGATLNLATLPTRNLNVRANTNPATVGSVLFTLNGSPYRLENIPPYALGSDDGYGDYAAWTPAVGSYSLTATPYTSSNAGGTAGTSLTVNFSVVDNVQYRYVRFVADSEVNGQPWTSMAEFNLLGSDGTRLSRSNWQVVSVSSQETTGEDGRIENILDGNSGTIWHTEWFYRSPAHPHEFVLDLRTNVTLSGFQYLPRQDRSNGRVAAYRFYVSQDGQTWTQVASGSFSNGTTERTVSFN